MRFELLLVDADSLEMESLWQSLTQPRIISYQGEVRIALTRSHQNEPGEKELYTMLSSYSTLCRYVCLPRDGVLGEEANFNFAILDTSENYIRRPYSRIAHLDDMNKPSP